MLCLTLVLSSSLNNLPTLQLFLLTFKMGEAFFSAIVRVAFDGQPLRVVFSLQRRGHSSSKDVLSVISYCGI